MGSGVFPGLGVAPAFSSVPAALREQWGKCEGAGWGGGGGGALNMKMELMYRRSKVDYTVASLLAMLSSV